MRVAALCDVHGNVPALEAVLVDLDKLDVDAIVFGGDIASGPLPRETVELVQSLDAVCVRGNADVLASPAMNPEWDAARRWVEQQLDPEQIRWLADLPFSWSADEALYVHANPIDTEEVVTERTPEERVAEFVRGVEESRVVTGHIHIQFTREVGGIEWIGAGSVGMPYEDAPGAYWALIDDEVEFRRTEYDYERAATAIRASGHPMADEFADENVLQVPSREEALRFLSP